MERVPQMQLPHAPVKAPCFRVRFPFQGKEIAHESPATISTFVVHICGPQDFQEEIKGLVRPRKKKIAVWRGEVRIMRILRYFMLTALWQRLRALVKPANAQISVWNWYRPSSRLSGSSSGSCRPFVNGATTPITHMIAPLTALWHRLVPQRRLHRRWPLVSRLVWPPWDGDGGVRLLRLARRLGRLRRA